MSKKKGPGAAKGTLSEKDFEYYERQLDGMASDARKQLDAIINKETDAAIERMQKHRQIVMEDHYPAGHQFTALDLFEISLGFILQEISGLKVLMRGDLVKAGVTEDPAQQDQPVIDQGAEA